MDFIISQNKAYRENQMVLSRWFREESAHISENMNKVVDFKNPEYSSIINWNVLFEYSFSLNDFLKTEHSDEELHEFKPKSREDFVDFIDGEKWFQSNDFYNKNVKGYCDRDINYADELIFPFFDLKHVKVNFSKDQYDDWRYGEIVEFTFYKFTYKSNNINIIIHVDDKGSLEFAFIQQNNNFLVVYLCYGHPSIYTNHFTFGNSDGSTSDLEIKGLNFMDAKNGDDIVNYVMCVAHMVIIYQRH